MNIGDLFLTLLADGSKLEASVVKEASKAGDAGGKTLGERMGQGATRALTVGGAAVGTFVASGIELFGKFQQRMNEVFTLLPGITEREMGKMTDDVKAFARETGVLPDEVIPALYQAISAGVPPDNVFDFLRTANKNAVGGVTDLETSVNGLSSVVNAYGADVLSAAEASDVMFTGVRLGKTTIGELSASLFQVIPTAAALGVGFGDVTAALAAMTAQGIPTSVATTQLRQLFVELSKESSATSKIFTDLTGKTFKEFVAEGGNVQDALILMEQAAAKDGKQINDLFSSVEAGSAALALTGKGAEKFTNNLEQMGESAGATDKAFELMETGIVATGKKIAATVATIAIDVGEKFQGIGPLLLALNQGGQLFGISPARMFGGVAGAITGRLVPGILGGFKGIAAKVLPEALTAGATTGTAMGGAAAGTAIATQSAGVAAGQVKVGAAAAGPARIAGGVIGRSMGAAAAAGFGIALLAAIPIILKESGFLDQLRLAINETLFGKKAAGDLADWESTFLKPGQVNPNAGASPFKGGIFDPLRGTGGLSPEDRQARNDLATIARIARMAQLEAHRRREGDGKLDTIDTSLTAIDATLTETQKQLHSDLRDAIATIEATDDSAAISAAVAAAVKSVLGGVGSGKTTTALIDTLKEELQAAEAANNAPLAAQIKSAIAQLEPFAKGRQWQSEQLTKAQAVVDSNKSTADKVAALKTIQADLLSHQRTMAADLVGKQIDTIAAIDKLPNRLKNALGGILFGGSAPGKAKDDTFKGPTPPKPKGPTINEGTGFTIPGKAAGGRFRARQPMIVGELRPELLIPDTSGTLLPRVPAGVGGNTYNVSIPGLPAAQDPFAVARQLRRLGDFGVLTPPGFR